MTTILKQKPFTESMLKKLAGATYFERGENYYARGMVFDLVEYEGTVTAKVHGTYEDFYQVELSQALDYECSCPLGDEGEFCKHCVATGLAWLEQIESQQAGSSKATAPQTDSISMQDVKQYLQNEKQEVLVEMLMKQALHDDRLRDRLFIQVAQSSKDKTLDLNKLKWSLNKVIQVRHFVEYAEMRSYTAGIQAMIDSLKEILDAGYANEVIELAEYALDLLEEAMNSVDDSSGHLGGLIWKVASLHHQACQQGSPDLKPLVEALFRRQLESSSDAFSDVLKKYADILGEAGLAFYRQLAEAEWEKYPPLKPNDQGREKYENRYAITSIMQDLAKQSGDLEALVTVHERDLSSAYKFLNIANLYQKAGLHEKAVSWAEAGLQAFPEKTDSRLRDFLAEAYQQQNNSHKAVELMWLEFKENPNLTNYQKLKAYASRQEDWEDPWSFLRIKALAFLRECIAKEQQQNKSRSAYVFQSGQSFQTLLVRIFLWEDNVQAAWEEAQHGNCSSAVQLKLAEQRGKTHPQDAITIYQEQIEPTLNLKNNQAYEQAVDFLLKIKHFMVQLNQLQAFKAYLQSLRVAHKAKRNFIKLLDSTKELH